MTNFELYFNSQKKFTLNEGSVKKFKTYNRTSKAQTEIHLKKLGHIQQIKTKGQPDRKTKQKLKGNLKIKEKNKREKNLRLSNSFFFCV